MFTYSKPDQNLTFNLPDEGQVFRNAGDANAVYKVVGGQLTKVGSDQNVATTGIRDTVTGQTYKAGDVFTGDTHNVSYTDPNFIGIGINKTTAAQQYGAGFSSLPEFNVTDFNAATKLMKQYGQSYGTNAAPVDPSLQGVTNPNANFQATGSTTGFTNNVPQTGQYPAQMANQGGANANTPAQNTQVNDQGTQNTQNGATTNATTQGGPMPPNVALQPGNTGPAVQQLQDYLVSQGLMSQQDLAGGYGTYGPKTTAAVAALQQKLGIDNTSGPGYFGPKTQAAISQGTQNQSTQGATNASGLTTGTQPTDTTPQGTDKYANLDPIQKQVAMYSDTYKALGLSDVKSQYEKIVNDEADLQNELADKIAEVNNNPWYSEGIRTKEVQKLQDKYQTKLDVLTHTATLMDSLYKQGLAQVETIVSGANADIKATNDLAQKQLDAVSALTKDNQIVSLNGREVLVNKVTGKAIADLGATTKNTTQGDITDANTASAEQTLLKAKGADGYTDPNLYAQVRSQAKIAPTEFDNRFAYLVNPLSRAKLGLTATNAGGGTQFLNTDFFKKSYTTDQLYQQATAGGYGAGLFGNKETAVTNYLASLDKTIQAYRDAGFADQDILKLMK